MIRRFLAVGAVAGVVLVPITANGAQFGQPVAISTESADLYGYTVTATADVVDALRRDDYDITAFYGVVDDGVAVEVVMSADEAAGLESRGLDVQLNDGDTVQSLRRASLAGDGNVFRPYGGEGGLAEEMEDLAEQYPDITDLEVIGQSGLGTDIYALQVTKNAGNGADGRKPTVVYSAAQHAREWITPEVNRRLLRYFLDNYGTDPSITDIVDTTELWFVLVANPDGYDYTHADPSNRLWRKTLRDNDGDGVITGFDGVDPNRNFPTFWGYDNEGSSDNPASETYRGPAPASEPETVALDGLIAKLTPEFLVNYHSAAELILYGIGYQVATPSPDDVLLATLAGDDDNPAIPGFDPDLSAELYTTNGETTEHMAREYGVLAYTPELSTCQSVSPPGSPCQSVFNFPDDEDLIQAEFEKNLPFALDVARSAQNPYEPVSHLGNTAPDFVLDTFSESHGESQTVAATVSRQLNQVQLRYRINGGPTRIAQTSEWDGGERYGADFDDYYREVRGVVPGLAVGDSVEVFFRGGTNSSGNEVSESFTFDVVDDPAEVLILANEDYDGFAPVQAITEPQYVHYYADALDANGISYDVYDLDARDTPHPLGILEHYDAVIWYTGDNVVTQDDNSNYFGPGAELGVAEQIQYTTVAVRDYLNEGGSLLKTGDNAGYFGPFLSLFGGLLYGPNGDPGGACTSFFTCLIYSDDFHQYWLGDYARSAYGTPTDVVGVDDPLTGLSIDLNGGDGAANSQDAGQTLVTSSVLPEDQFPQFASRAIADYPLIGPPPFDPLTGDWMIGVNAQNNQYNRFTRTVDLTAASSATLSFDASWDVEAAYDIWAVEVHTVGGDDWTTLPDTNGNTSQQPWQVCFDGLWNVHPFLFDHYVDPSCAPVGPTGELHAFNGDSGGWTPVSMDLSAFAGSEVEISFSYISDVGVTNTGVVVDNVVIDVDGSSETQGWEDDQDPWAAAPPPADSPGTITDWERRQVLVDQRIAAAVATDSTVYLPFGFEAVSTAAERNELMGRIMGELLSTP